MPSVPLNIFIEFTACQGTARVDAATLPSGDYDPRKDFYKRLRERTVRQLLEQMNGTEWLAAGDFDTPNLEECPQRPIVESPVSGFRPHPEQRPRCASSQRSSVTSSAGTDHRTAVTRQSCQKAIPCLLAYERPRLPLRPSSSNRVASEALPVPLKICRPE